ncbi:hypothetical protein C7S14_2817 [Burkholderia cepacia]|nr:hypothetical protein C7S14_2817 [Burkholderia cepacia]
MGATRRDAARRACRASDPDTACVECTAVSGLQEGYAGWVNLTNCKVSRGSRKPVQFARCADGVLKTPRGGRVSDARTARGHPRNTCRPGRGSAPKALPRWLRT